MLRDCIAGRCNLFAYQGKDGDAQGKQTKYSLVSEYAKGVQREHHKE